MKKFCILIRAALFSLIILLICPVTLSNADTLPEIHVAGQQWLETMWREDDLELIRLVIPPMVTLPAHSTGPRVVVLLSQAQIQRVEAENDTLTQLPRWGAYWLENETSGAVKNMADSPLDYLALLIPGKPASASPLDCKIPPGSLDIRVLLIHEKSCVYRLDMHNGQSGQIMTSGRVLWYASSLMEMTNPDTGSMRLDANQAVMTSGWTGSVTNLSGKPGYWLLFVF